MLRTKQQGSWMRAKNLRKVGPCMGAIFTVGFLINVGVVEASIALPNARQGHLNSGGCSSELSSLFLAGSFTMPGTAQKMGVWIGKRDVKDLKTVGLVGRSDAAACEAVCKIMRFERFRKDAKPALMELECEGARVKTLRMPLHIQWSAMGTSVRLGSSIYGVEQASLELLVNRYTVAAK